MAQMPLTPPRPPARPRRGVPAAAEPATLEATRDRRMRERVESLVALLGNNRLAELLEVSPSQPSRWRSGAEAPSPLSQRKVIDLDYVMSRLLELWRPRIAALWLEGHNSYLRARPIDVFRLSGAAPVVEAIDFEAQGAML
jgi:hypothetical protein